VAHHRRIADVMRHSTSASKSGPKLDLNHLDNGQRSDILKILEKHKDIFSDRPGLCNAMIAEHVITLNIAEQNWPKQPKPYQVPPIFRGEVERQIQELL